MYVKKIVFYIIKLNIKMDIFKLIDNDDFEGIKKLVNKNDSKKFFKKDILSIKNNKYENPLYYMVKKGKLELIKEFLNIVSCDIYRILYTSIRFKKWDITKYLIDEKEIDVNFNFDNSEIDYYFSLYEQICYYGDVDIVKYIENKGIDKYKNYFPGVYAASINNNLNVLKYLIEDLKHIKEVMNKTITVCYKKANQSGAIHVAKFLLDMDTSNHLLD